MSSLGPLRTAIPDFLKQSRTIGYPPAQDEQLARLPREAKYRTQMQDDGFLSSLCYRKSMARLIGLLPGKFA